MMVRISANKYSAKRTEYDGVNYDSKMEAKWAQVLDMRMEAGEIVGWERQVTFSIGPARVRWTVDFMVYTEYGRVEIHEVKGFETEPFRIKKKLWKEHGLCDLLIIKSNKGAMYTSEVVER